MSKYADYLAEDMRLVMLRILNEMPAYSSNSSILGNVLGRFGHHPSRDHITTQLHWLAEQNLISIEDVSGVLVCRLTERGQDVATGRTTVPGVKKPGA